MAAEESRLEMAETQLDRASTPACRGQRPGLCSVGLPAWKERARVAPPRDDYLEQSSGSALRLLHPPVSSYLIRKALGEFGSSHQPPTSPLVDLGTLFSTTAVEAGKRSAQA